MAVQVGRLNKRITLQKPGFTRLPSGQKVPEWLPFCTVWAEVQCTDSRAVSAEGLIQHEGLYRFYVRWRRGITAQMRVLWDDRTFEQVGPPADWKGEKDGLTLLCRELVKEDG